MQNSLEDFVGLTPDGRAVYSNVKDISFTRDGSKLTDRLGRTMVDFEAQEVSLFGNQITVEKPINPKYYFPAFLTINRTAHDLVEYSRNDRYGKVLWLSHISVQSVNSNVKVEVEIIEIDKEDEHRGISVSLIGALEDISQVDVTRKGAIVSITPKKSWSYVPSKKTYDNIEFDHSCHSIVGEIPIEKLKERKVLLTIKVPEGAEQCLWDKHGHRKW